jgi:pSer/pThr/pTyr-binding forkhead associated (FHA) protein
MKPAKLRIIGGGQCDEEIDLEPPTVIGRGRDNDITLSHSLVSRHHCRLCWSGDQLLVQDLNSLNGTYIGNERVQGEALLRPGQLLTVGTVTFRAIYGELLAEEGEGQSVIDDETVDLAAEATLVDPSADRQAYRPQPSSKPSAASRPGPSVVPQAQTEQPG